MLGRSTTAVQSALNRKVGGSNPPVPAKPHGASVYWLWTLPSQGSEGGFDSHKPYHFLFLCGVTVYRSGPLPFKQLMVGSTPTDATKTLWMPSLLCVSPCLSYQRRGLLSKTSGT